VKYDSKECKYCDSFEQSCVKIIFLFLNIFITGKYLLLSISSFHHELFSRLNPIWNFSFGTVSELRNIGPNSTNISLHGGVLSDLQFTVCTFLGSCGTNWRFWQKPWCMGFL